VTVLKKQLTETVSCYKVTNGAVGGDKTHDWKTMEEAQTQGTPLNMPLADSFKQEKFNNTHTAIQTTIFRAGFC